MVDALDLFARGVVAGGPRPDTATAAAFECTMDLRWGRRPSPYEHPRHLRFPLKGHQPYVNPYRLRHAVDTIDAFVREARGGRMLVHCENGINRTGVVLIAWLCRRGVPFEDATRAVEASLGARPREAILRWLRSILPRFTGPSAEEHMPWPRRPTARRPARAQRQYNHPGAASFEWRRWQR